MCDIHIMISSVPEITIITVYMHAYRYGVYSPIVLKYLFGMSYYHLNWESEQIIMSLPDLPILHKWDTGEILPLALNGHLEILVRWLYKDIRLLVQL